MNNYDTTLTTQNEVVEHLVSNCGIKQGWAQAMVTEYFHFDHDTLLTRDQGDDGFEFNAKSYNVVATHENYWLVVHITGAQAFDWYKDWLTYYPTETADGITFDGNLVYNLQGFYL